MIDIEAIKKITKNYIKTDEFKKQIIEIYKKELENEVLKKYVKVLLDFYELEFMGWINEQLKTMNDQGWDIDDLSVIRVGVWNNAIQLMYSTPNGNRFDVFLNVFEDSLLDKKKYNKLVKEINRVKMEIENIILKEKIRELEEELEKKRNKPQEYVCNCNCDYEEYGEDDDYEDDP